MQAEGRNYTTLKALGFDLWWPKNPEIVTEPLIIYARCAVLLFASQQNSHKVLTGMLSVLALKEEELMIVKINPARVDLKLLANNLISWQPATILQLSMEIPALVGFDNLVRTYSPNFLMDNPQHKQQAYKDLLTLKERLHNNNANQHT